MTINDAPRISVGTLDIVATNVGGNNLSVLLGNLGGFAPQVQHATGVLPLQVALGDLDGDGDLDIVAANAGSDSVSVLLGDGAGGFAGQVQFAAGDYSWSVALGDLDGDGNLDIVTANGYGGNVSVLLGNGAGGFAPQTQFAAGSRSSGVSVGDIDGDGDLDIVTANHSGLSNSVSVLRNDGNGAFSAHTAFATGFSPYSTALGDLDGDGDLDIVASNNGSNSVSVLLNDGNGAFSAPTNHAVGAGVRATALYDLDGDGALDIVAANFGGNTISVLLGNGSGGFGPQTQFATGGSGPRYMGFGDIDRDGAVDIVIANSFSNNVSLLRGDGAGSFSAAVTFPAGANALGLALGNLDTSSAIDEDTTLTFDAAHGNAIVVADLDGNGADETVTLSALHGKATLATTAGLTSVTGNGTGTVVLTGSIAEINTALDGLVYAPNAHFNGDDTITITINDNGNTGSGGARTATTGVAITVRPLDDAPDGTNKTIAALEDAARVLTAADFGFVDPDGHALASVTVTTLPGAGSLTLDGVAVTSAQVISVADINAGKLAFKADPNANGVAYADLTFQVKDNGGGIDLDPTPNTLAINVSAVNDAPSGTNNAITALEDTARVLTAANFGFTDTTDGNSLAAVKVTTLPGAGKLTLNGAAIAAGQLISIADINAGKLAFKGALNANGAAYAAFTFQVQDNGGTAGGGVDLDQSPNVLTINVTPVNDAPTAVNFSNVHGPFAENASTAAATKIADIAVTDIDGGTNILSVAGADAALFQLIGGDLWLRAGAKLDFETNPLLNVTVNVNGVGVGGAIDASRSLAIAITNVNENTTINGTGGPDTLHATANGETINGLGGNDRIFGNGGDDRIVGGTGVDIMTGGPGKDVFVFNSMHDSAPGQSGYVNNSSYGAIAGQGLRDIITDFTHGVDKLDFSAIDANTKVAGNQAFLWKGAGNFTLAPGQLIMRQFNPAGTANDKTIVYGDINGDAKADFQVELAGLKTLTLGDFVL